MGKNKISLLVSTLLLTSCFMNDAHDKIQNDERNYEDYSSLFLEWKDLFSPAKPQYFAYIYSEHCYYCNKIKYDIFDFIDSGLAYIYLIKFDDSINVSNDVEQSIGVQTYEEVFIKGTPTLLKIKDNQLVLNLAGCSNIIEYINSEYAYSLDS